MIFIVYLTKTSYLCLMNNKNCKMKKILTLAFAALTLLATACGKSNDENPKPQNDAKKALIGTWYLVSTSEVGDQLTECDKKEHFVITESTITHFTTSETKEKGCLTEEAKSSYTIKNDTLIVGKTTFLFSVLGDKLTLTFFVKDGKGNDQKIDFIYQKH